MTIKKLALLLLSLGIAHQLCSCTYSAASDDPTIADANDDDFFDVPAETHYAVSTFYWSGSGISVGARPAPADEQGPSLYKTNRVTAEIQNWSGVSGQETSLGLHMACTSLVPGPNGTECIPDLHVIRYEGDSTLHTDCRDVNGNPVQVWSSFVVPSLNDISNDIIFFFTAPPWFAAMNEGDVNPPSCRVWFNLTPMTQSHGNNPDEIASNMSFGKLDSDGAFGRVDFGYPIVLEHEGEICDNGIDDDGNDLLDCLDPSCHCGKISKDPTNVVNTPTPDEQGRKIAQWTMHNKIDPTNAQVSLATDGIAVSLSYERGDAIFFDRIEGSANPSEGSKHLVNLGHGKFIYESATGEIRSLKVTEKIDRTGARAFKVDKMVVVFPFTVDTSHDPKFVQTVHIGTFSAYTRGNWRAFRNGWKLTSVDLVYP